MRGGSGLDGLDRMDNTTPHPGFAGPLPQESRLVVRDLGLIEYEVAFRLQEQLVEQHLRGEAPDTLLLLEHPPVITLGRRGTEADIYLPVGALEARGIAVHRSTRGGLVTYHGPGQVVGYPIVHLRRLGRTIPEYVRGLERTIVAALAETGVAARVDEQHVGVWTDRGKIAAIGVGQRHGISLHGFAVNLQPDLGHFALINSCGIGDLGVTSAAAILGSAVDVAEFKRRLAHAFASEFGYVGYVFRSQRQTVVRTNRFERCASMRP